MHPFPTNPDTGLTLCSANTLTTNAGKKTIMPADVFAALDDIEFGFMREQLEAEFASE